MSGNPQMFLKHKIVFLGDVSVGKTSIILRFSQDTFDNKQKVSGSDHKGADRVQFTGDCGH